MVSVLGIPRVGDYVRLHDNLRRGVVINIIIKNKMHICKVVPFDNKDIIYLIPIYNLLVDNTPSYIEEFERDLSDIRKWELFKKAMEK